MRFGAWSFVLSLVIGVLLGAATSGVAWSQTRPGEVLSENKISDTQGNFTATIDNLDEFGGAVAGLGDLDGAGPSVAAVAVGAIGDDDGGGNRGAVYILFLNSLGSVLSYQKISDTQGNFTATMANTDEFGSSVAFLGDLDGAGPSVAAIAVGAAGDDDGGSARGCVYILFLNSAGSVLSYQTISDTQGNFSATIDNADEFGAAVAGLGDLDGAGPSAGALAVGVAMDDDGGLNFGAVYVLFLNSAGSVLSWQKTSSTVGGFTASLATADEFGSCVEALGDLDGAGPSTLALAVGAIGDDDGGTDRGAVYILFLNSAGSLLSYQKISDTEGNFTAPLDNLDEFGGAVANLGDIDPWGPSVTALAVGVGGDDDGGQSRGAGYVLFLNNAGQVVSYQLATGNPLNYQKISDTAGNFSGVLDDGDEFGGSVARLGDLDGSGDAAQTIVVGASFDDDGGEDRGAVYVLSLRGVTVSSSERSPEASLHALGPARPNPFNPQTSISYVVGVAGQVQIEIYDVEGRLVRSLVQEKTPAGRHEAVWDGRDQAGRALASGTYFYRMAVDGRLVSASRKAVLLK